MSEFENLESDLTKIMVVCSCPEDIVWARNNAMRRIPREMRKAFSTVFSSYLARFDIEGIYERMNNRSVAQILAEFQPADLPVVEEGMVDGIRYRLVESPRPPEQNDANRPE